MHYIILIYGDEKSFAMMANDPKAQEQMYAAYTRYGGDMTDLLGGQIDLSVDTITVIEPQVRSGNVRALGVTSAAKWWSLPDIVPVAETVPGYDVQTWLGLAAPKGTPAPVVQRLNAAMRSGLADAQVEARLRKIGMFASSVGTGPVARPVQSRPAA